MQHWWLHANAYVRVRFRGHDKARLIQRVWWGYARGRRPAQRIRAKRRVAERLVTLKAWLVEVAAKETLRDGSVAKSAVVIPAAVRIQSMFRARQGWLTRLRIQALAKSMR